MKKIDIKVKHFPVLDPGFVPASLWNREYRRLVKDSGKGKKLVIALTRPNGMVSIFKTQIFPNEDEWKDLNLKYIERLIKAILWMEGGYKITIAGSEEIADKIRGIYCEGGARSFDNEIVARKIYGHDFEVISCSLEDAPESSQGVVALGRNFSGNRIGFDLGGSDRKCAAVVDGKIVFSEEIAWDPYFWKDPQKHYEGINDSLKRAAAHLPKVDAIGGSAAGVYVSNQVKVASLFRGVSEDDFEKYVKDIFIRLKEEWGVPFDVINDGDVTALAGAISLNDNALLGVAMGTSEAVGYISPEGNVTDWLNELAFAPVDYRENGPVDEWSGDEGCGVQYFSQQAVGRLAPLAGLEFPDDLELPEQLVEVQDLMKIGAESAVNIYKSIGVYFGYAVAHYAEFYDIRNLMILGRVTSGKGGEVIIEKAKEVLKDEFPELFERINFTIPDEKMKRHGQAVAAASLPVI